MLPLILSDTAATSQDGSFLEFIVVIAGRQCYIQDASGGGLWYPHRSRDSVSPVCRIFFATFDF